MKFTVKFLRGGLAFVTCYGVWYVVLTGINSATKVVDSATSKDNLMEGSSLVAESIASLDYHDETLNKIKDTAAAMKELPKDSYLGPLLESPYMYAGNHTFPPEVDEVWQTRSNYSIDHFEPCKDCFFSRDCFSDNLWHPQTCGAVRLFGPQHPIPVECLERESILLIGDSRARLLYFDIFAAMGGDERLVDYIYCDPHLYDADRYEPLEPWSFLTAYHTGELRPRRFFRGYIRTGREEKPTIPDTSNPHKLAYIMDPYLMKNRTRLNYEVEGMGEVTALIMAGAWFVDDVGDFLDKSSRRFLKQNPEEPYTLEEEKDLYDQQLHQIVQILAESPKVKRVLIMADFERIYVPGHDNHSPESLPIMQAMSKHMRESRARVAAKFAPKAVEFNSYFPLMRKYVDFCQTYADDAKALHKAGTTGEGGTWDCSMDFFHPSPWLVSHVVDLLFNGLCSQH